MSTPCTEKLMYAYFTVSQDLNDVSIWNLLASSPGHSQLSVFHVRTLKAGSGLGTRLETCTVSSLLTSLRVYNYMASIVPVLINCSTEVQSMMTINFKQIMFMLEFSTPDLPRACMCVSQVKFKYLTSVLETDHVRHWHYSWWCRSVLYIAIVTILMYICRWMNIQKQNSV